MNLEAWKNCWQTVGSWTDFMNIPSQLKSAIREYVRLVNGADVEMLPGPLRLHVHGRLEEPDDTGEWTVRIKECGHGVSVIGFTLSHIESVYRKPSGILEITLR